MFSETSDDSRESPWRCCISLEVAMISIPLCIFTVVMERVFNAETAKNESSLLNFTQFHPAKMATEYLRFCHFCNILSA
jgi:hypothetical protein